MKMVQCGGGGVIHEDCIGDAKWPGVGRVKACNGNREVSHKILHMCLEFFTGNNYKVGKYQ